MIRQRKVPVSIYGMWAVYLLICQIFQQHALLGGIGATGSYALQALAVYLLVTNIKKACSVSSIKSASFIFIFCSILILYQFTFGLFEINEKTWTYLLAKVVTCLMIAYSVIEAPNIYHEKVMSIVATVTSILIIIGFVYGDFSFSGRHTLGFGNPNGLGVLAAICAGSAYLDSSGTWKKRNIVIVLCIIGTLLSGSRSSIGILCLALWMKHGLNFKILVPVILVVITTLIIFPMLGISSSGVGRFTQTVADMDLSSNREQERLATLLMIKESPIIGNGLYAEMSENAKKISLLGSHNGYLDIMKMIGIPFATILFAFMAYFTALFWGKFRNSHNCFDRMHLFIVLSVLIAANFESYIWGVYQIITTLFFLSFSVLQTRSYHISHRRHEALRLSRTL